MRPSLFRMALLLLAEGARGVRTPCPVSYANSADRRVFAETLRLRGGLSGTPARRAFDKPMAMTCLVERAPCLPCRTWCISSRTNSPAAVEGDFPLRRSSLAFLTVRFDGMTPPPSGSSPPRVFISPAFSVPSRLAPGVGRPAPHQERHPPHGIFLATTCTGYSNWRSGPGQQPAIQSRRIQSCRM